MTNDARALAAALGARAEEVCRTLLPRGRRAGRYWTVGGLDGAPGRSMWVRLRPPGRPGRWVDAATGEHGDLLDLIAHRLGAGSLGPALEEARALLALPPAPCRHAHPPPASRAERTGAARRVWDASRPLARTPAEAYLRARGIEPGARPALRFHPALHYRFDETRREPLPALVAASGGALAGVHRTWLDPRTAAKAPVPAPRKSLGPVHGLAARFAGAPRYASLLVAGEGLETVLSVLAAVPELPGAAALCAPGLAAFTPPPGTARLLIARDNDPAGERAAWRLRRRCRELGIDARVLVPERGDFNDDLLALGPGVLAERIAPLLDAGAPRPPRRGPPPSGTEERSLSPEPIHARRRPMPDTPHEPAPTYTRLRSGAWGVRVPEAVRPLARGETARVTVRRRSGRTGSETVRCFWRGTSPRTGEPVALCEILPPPPDDAAPGDGPEPR